MKKFKYAFNGLKECFKDKAIVTQFILGLFAIIGGLIIKLNFNEWLAFIICIVGVISFEILNSVIEELCNLYSNEVNLKIKRIKDISSAAVLVFSFGTLVICILCVLRRII